MLIFNKLCNFTRSLVSSGRCSVGRSDLLAAACSTRRHAVLVSLAALYGLGVAPTTFAASFYVSPSGSDSNPGTEERPFRNPQAAAEIVNPGDVVYLMNGVYPASTSDKRVMNLVRSGTQENMITFRNYPGHTPQIGRLPATTDDQYGFVTHGADYIRFEGLAFAGHERKCIYIANMGDNGSTGIEIVGNTFDQCGRAHRSCAVQNGHTAIDSGPYTNGMLTERNIFRDSGRQIDPACDLLSNTENHQYRHDHHAYLKGKGHIFRNNIVLGHPAGLGVKMDGYMKSLGQTVAPNFSHIIVNNTFGPNVSVQPYDKASGHPIGAVNSTPDSYDPRWLIANNIFMEPARSGSPYPTAVLIRDVNYVNFPTGNVCRNNITTGTVAIATCGENNPNVAVNVSVSGNTLGVSDIQFVSSTDLRLTGSSPAIGHGDATIAPPIDFAGNSRDLQTGVVDSGAYEFTSGITPESETLPKPKPPTFTAVQSQ